MSLSTSLHFCSHSNINQENSVYKTKMQSPEIFKHYKDIYLALVFPYRDCCPLHGFSCKNMNHNKVKLWLPWTKPWKHFCTVCIAQKTIRVLLSDLLVVDMTQKYDWIQELLRLLIIIFLYLSKSKSVHTACGLKIQLSLKLILH